MKKRIIKQFLTDAQKISLYDVGETIEGLALKIGDKPQKIVKLNSNENYFVPIDFLRTIMREIVEEVDPRIYPRDEVTEVRRTLCKHLGVSNQEIVLGPGSDPLIDMVARIFLVRGDEAVSIAPTFSIYERCVKIQGATYRPVPLKKDFSLDIEGILDSIIPKTKVILLCSPNNPTANLLDRKHIFQLTERFDGIVAVDEAYVDFSGGSVIDMCRRTDNLIVFRTFSKVFGLAGLRIGYAIADKDVATAIDQRFQMPYTVSLVTLKTALKVVENIQTINTAVEELKNERQKLIERLNGIEGVQAFNSDTNFVLFRIAKSSHRIYEKLLKEGVMVRNIGSILNLENCLRVTVAPEPKMEKFLVALKRVLKE